MFLQKIICVGFPETILNIVFVLLIWKGKEALFQKSNIFKIPIASIVLPIIFFFIKTKTTSLSIQIIISIIVFSLAFRYIFNMGLRNSAINSMVMLIYLILIEVISIHFVTRYMESIIKAFGFFHVNSMIIWTIPTRIFQILAIGVIYRYKICYKNNPLLFNDWSKLEKSDKKTIFILIRHLFASLILNTAYLEIYFHDQRYAAQIPEYIPNYMVLYIIQICSIYFLFSSLQLFMRLLDYEDLKGIFLQGPVKLFRTMLDASSKELLEEYKQDLDKKIEEKEFNFKEVK